jgi:glycosyltransferase involved in cell wall biosynthesis
MNRSQLKIRRRPSVLLSAYACEPYLGSEHGVGWQWAVALARLGYEVWVITQAKYQAGIEQALAQEPVPNLHPIYHAVFRRENWWKSSTSKMHLYYLLWQAGAYFVARRLMRRQSFDIAHHVTWVSVRFPSFMGLLGIPFIFGPVAGGDYSPSSLWRGLGAGVCLHESLRRISNLWVRYSPLMNLTFLSARRIFVTSEQTADLLPDYAKARSSVLLGITANRYTESLSQLPLRQRGAGEPFQVFFAGRFVALKGMHFGLKAFARLQAEVARAQLTMIGSGPMLRQWRELADKLGIGANVTWRDSMPRGEFMRALSEFDVLLFPSLHDSGGMVVMEAMAAGIPVVCLDVGGPGILVDETCGFRIAATVPQQVVQGLAEALCHLARQPGRCKEMGRNARRHVAEVFSPSAHAKSIDHVYRTILEQHATASV